MVRVTYVCPEGTETTVDGEPGRSVMEAALDADVDGIVGECGGNAMCATCHVYVEHPAADALPAMEPDEEEMLRATASPREVNSRLGCQLVLGSAVDGLVVRIPKEQ